MGLSPFNIYMKDENKGASALNLAVVRHAGCSIAGAEKSRRRRLRTSIEPVLRQVA